MGVLADLKWFFTLTVDERDEARFLVGKKRAHARYLEAFFDFEDQVESGGFTSAEERQRHEERLEESQADLFRFLDDDERDAFERAALESHGIEPNPRVSKKRRRRKQ